MITNHFTKGISSKDREWWKKFAEGLKKDIKQSQKSKKDFSSQMVSEIVCTQKDIGEPTYFPKRKKRKK